MNWKYEAKRIAAAFGAEGRCVFKDTKAGKQLLGDSEEWIEVAQNGDVWEFCFMYIDHLTRIDIRNRHNLKAMLTLDHRGEIVNLWKHGLESRLVKPLVNLGILTDEIEEALGATVTATERLEWAMDYEARLKPAKHPALPPRNEPS